MTRRRRPRTRRTTCIGGSTRGGRRRGGAAARSSRPAATRKRKRARGGAATPPSPKEGRAARRRPGGAGGSMKRRGAGGRGAAPPIPKEVQAGQSRPGADWPTSGAEDAAARSVFVFVKRSLAVPLLAVFDAPDPDSPCPVRFTTTQPTQALGMLNGEVVNSQAKVFAESVAKEAGGDVAAQVRLALRRITQRAPTAEEVDRGMRFVAALRDEDKLPADEAVRRFCLLALNLNEFVYLD